MKRIFNKKIIGLGVLVLVFAGFFLAKSYANREKGYEIDLTLKIEGEQDPSIVRPSHRQVVYYKINKENMGPWEMMRLAKDCDKMSVEEVSKKLGQEAKYSEKSKLVFDNKEYDQMTDAMFDKNKGKVKEKIQIKNLKEGSYLIKETDESFKKSKAKEKLRTRIEYVGKESAPDGVLDLE